MLIVGCGGIGSMVAFNLEAGGLASVVAVLRSNYDAVKQQGFQIDSQAHGQRLGWRPSRIVASVSEATRADGSRNDDADESYDFIVCTTKNIPEAPTQLCDLIRPVVSRGQSILVLIQNGLNIEKSIQKAFPDNICLSGVSFMGAYEVEPGRIQQTDRDRLVVSPFLSSNIDHDEQVQAARTFQALYAASGKVQCDYEYNVAHIRWRKLLYNAVWNPICAITDMDTTRLRMNFERDDPLSPLNTLVRPAINEIRAAASKVAGLELPDSIVEDIVNADPLDIFCVPSMLQDRRRGKLLSTNSWSVSL